MRLHKNCQCANSYWRSQSSISMIVLITCRSPWQTSLAEFLLKCLRWLIEASICEEISLKSHLLKLLKSTICRCRIVDLLLTNKTTTWPLIWAWRLSKPTGRGLISKFLSCSITKYQFIGSSSSTRLTKNWEMLQARFMTEVSQREQRMVQVKWFYLVVTSSRANGRMTRGMALAFVSS